MATTAPTVGIDGNNGPPVNIPAGSYKGPYLEPHGGINNTGIPVNPFIDMHAAQPNPNKLATHWSYVNSIIREANGTNPLRVIQLEGPRLTPL